MQERGSMYSGGRVWASGFGERSVGLRVRVWSCSKCIPVTSPAYMFYGCY